MGIDFVLVDLSNSVSEAALSATDAVFDTYLNRTSPHPNICLLVSTFLAESVDQLASVVQKRYLDNPRYAPLLQQYNGKPLLIYFTGPHTTLLPPLQ